MEIQSTVIEKSYWQIYLQIHIRYNIILYMLCTAPTTSTKFSTWQIWFVAFTLPFALLLATTIYKFLTRLWCLWKSDPTRLEAVVCGFPSPLLDVHVWNFLLIGIAPNSKDEISKYR